MKACDLGERAHDARPLVTVSPDTDASEVISRMENAQVRRIPVVGDTGSLLGIIAPVLAAV